MNSGEYRWFGAVFADNTTLPENAEVIDYYYYNYYYGEARDEYLELRFQTEEQTIEYLTSLIDEIKISLSDRTIPKYGEWFYEEQNPYNASYNDIFCLHNHVYQPALGDKPYYSGYSITTEGNETTIDAYCGIISYSIEEKTVIQAFFKEFYNSSYERYFIPKYLKRFNVPTTESHERYFYFN